MARVPLSSIGLRREGPRVFDTLTTGETGGRFATARLRQAQERNFARIAEARADQTAALVSQSRAVEALGSTTSEIGRLFTAAAQEREERETALRRSTEAANAEAAYLRGLTEDLVTLRASDATGTDFSRGFEEAARKRADEALSGIEDEELRIALNNRFTALTTSRLADALVEGDRREDASHLDQYKQRLVDLSNDAVLARGLDQVLILQEAKRQGEELAAQGVWTIEESRKSFLAFRATVASATLRTDIAADPAAVIAALETDAYDTLLSEAEKVDWRGEAQRALEQRQRNIAQAATTEYQRRLSDLEIAVARGEVGEAQIEAAYQDGAGWLKPNDRTSLIKQADKARAEAQAVAARAAMMDGARDGGLRLDPRDETARQAVNEDYARWFPTVAESPDVVAKVVRYVADFGIMPESLRAGLRGSLRSGTVDQKVQAADIIDRFNTENPAVLNDMADEDIEVGVMVARAVRAGEDPEQAVALAETAIYQADPKLREVRREVLREETNTNREWLTSHVPGPTFLLRAFAGDSLRRAEIPDSMVADFNALFALRFLSSDADVDTLRTATLGKLAKTWAVTNVDGSNRWMRYAPEALYGFGDDHTWMREQLFADIKASGLVDNRRTIDDRVRIAATEETARPPRNEAPTYAVMLQDDDGVFQPLIDDQGRPLRWRPDWNTSPAKAAAEEQVQTDIDAARQFRVERNAAFEAAVERHEQEAEARADIERMRRERLQDLEE